VHCNFLNIAFVVLCAAGPALGSIKNLGVTGQTYPVVEPDLVAELQQKATTNPVQQEIILSQLHTYQPAGLHRLPRATRDMTYSVDMSYTLDRDLVNGRGKVIYPKGFTFNPLDYVSFPGALLILDGNDPDQIDWFRATPYVHDHQLRLLISDGYAQHLIEQLKRPVFYLTDEIAERLQLSAVPALVLQNNDMLQVHEFLVPKKQ